MRGLSAVLKVSLSAGFECDVQTRFSFLKLPNYALKLKLKLFKLEAHFSNSRTKVSLSAGFECGA